MWAVSLLNPFNLDNYLDKIIFVGTFITEYGGRSENYPVSQHK